MTGCSPRLLLATVVLALTPTLALAADEAGGHGAEKGQVVGSIQQGLAPAIATLIVFGVVCLVLYSQVWPKITKGLDDRNEKIRSEIRAAERAREDARSALEEYERSLQQARAEAQRMLDDTKAQQAALAAELRSKADRELTQMREKARRDIEAAKRAALNEIYAESVSLATAIAGKILQREVTADDRDRLIQESLEEIGTLSAS